MTNSEASPLNLRLDSSLSNAEPSSTPNQKNISISPVMAAEASHGGDTVLSHFPGSDLSISELCYALTTKLAQASDPGYVHNTHFLLETNSADSSRSPIRSAENDLRTAARKRIIHRLPCEILAMVASHLEDDTSLVAATHVCHLWRTALLSSPRLWSNLSFVNEKRGLAFLERSGSTPLYVDLTGADDPSEAVKESLRTIGARVTALQGVHSLFLDEILDQSAPVLELLDLSEAEEAIQEIPIRSTLIISGALRTQFHAPCLTTFRFTESIRPFPRGGMSNFIAKFLQGFPLLKEVYVKYREDELESENLTTDDLVSVPHLCSFTDATPYPSFNLGLFNRLSIPPTCQVAFTTNQRVFGRSAPCHITLPTLRDPFNLSDPTCARFLARSHNLHPEQKPDYAVFTIELVNSSGTRVSIEAESGYVKSTADYLFFAFLMVSGRVELCSAKTLCLDHFEAPAHLELSPLIPDEDFIEQRLRGYRNLKTLILVESSCFLSLDLCLTIHTLVVYSSRVVVPSEGSDSKSDIIGQVRGIAKSRQEAGFPIKTLTLVIGDDEAVVQERRGELEELKSYAGHVQVVSGDDALDWDTDKYFSGDHDHTQG